MLMGNGWRNCDSMTIVIVVVLVIVVIIVIFNVILIAGTTKAALGSISKVRMPSCACAARQAQQRARGFPFEPHQINKRSCESLDFSNK